MCPIYPLHLHLPVTHPPTHTRLITHTPPPPACPPPQALIHQSSSWVRHLTHQPPVKVGQPSWVFAADDAGHVLQLTQQTKGPTYR
jgi:hypothetical protein